MKYKKHIAIMTGVLVLCTAFCFVCKPVYYRLYLGDRIRGEIQVIVDGQTYTLTEAAISDCRTVTPNSNGSANIRIKAGEYGAYTFELSVNTLAQPITVRCFQHNWWNVMEFDLQINADTQQNHITYSGSITTIADNGRKMTDTINKEQTLTETLSLSFGL